MFLLPYFFLGFFVVDFHFQTKIDFLVHHAIGAILSVYAICVHDLNNKIMKMVFAVEMSTPFLLAIMYLPEAYTSLVKVLFVCVFYITRIEQYGASLLQYDFYIYPYYGILLTALWALFATNLYWFALIVKKTSSKTRIAIGLFAFASLYLHYFY